MNSGRVLWVAFDLAVVLSFIRWQSPESLEPDEMMDLLRRSNLEIHMVSYGELPTLTHTLLRFSRGPPPKKTRPRPIAVLTQRVLL